MKKLCFVTTVSLTVRSFLIPVLRYLRDRTPWELTVICDIDDSLQNELPAGVRYIPVPMKRGISLGGIGACWKMYQIFREEKFDLVQYSTPNASLYASLAAWLARVPVRLYCQWGMAFVGFRGVKRAVFKCIEKLVCTLSTWVEPDSFGNLEFSHREGLYPPGKSCVIWNGSASGVDLEKFDIRHRETWRQEIRQKYQLPADAMVLGFVGRITGDKGINELFSAFRRLLDEWPQTYLMLVGNMEKADSVDQALYDWARGEERVVFCGYTNVVEQYLAAMDAYVLPSYREGFGSVVIEAEAMGVPVIVTDIPGPTDAMLPDETGLVVKVRDVESLHCAMERLAGNPELRERLGKAGAAFAARNFDQKILTEKILADRKRLLGMCEE